MAGITNSIDLPGQGGPGPTILGRMAALVRDRSDVGAARRFAALAFGARVANAGLGFGTQILLARWMGDREYGIYAYLWVALLLAGGIGSLGLPVAALKLVPDYTARGDLAGLRGFLRVARGAALAPSSIAALLAGAAVAAFATGEAAPYMAPALIGLAILPLYVLMDIQTGIARAYDFVDLGLAADYVLRPVLLLLFAGIAYLAGSDGSAAHVMLATLGSVAGTALVQGVLLHARIHVRLPAGPRRNDRARWLELAWPLLAVTTFTLLLGSTDVLVLKLFVGPEQIALYFAATKIIAIASFVSYGVSNTSAHRFASHMATGDRAAMSVLAAETVRWTFWPTLAVAIGLAVVGVPLLRLFGAQFAAGYPVLVILGLGLVAGATVGPADRALAMADHGRLTAWIYAASFVANVLLALALTPLFGLEGAAAATALAFAGRAFLLRRAAWSRLGLDMFVLARPIKPASLRGGTSEGLVVEMLTAHDVEAISTEWQALATRALEPNFFHSVDMAAAGLRHLPERDGAEIVAVWCDGFQGRRLVGILPIVRPSRRYFNPMRLRRAAAFYGTLSTPLLDPDRPAETLQAMLRLCAQHGYPGLLLPYMGLGGPAAVALDEMAARYGKTWVTLDSHRRAMLRSELSGADYVRATLETKRRKEADRQRRRLSELGELRFAMVEDPADVAEALELFFELEAAGWKGEAGTDLAHATGAASFVREAAARLAARRALRVALLMLDGRLVAAGLVGIAGRRAFFWKTAYDESLARFSPGFLLTLDLTAHLLDDPGIDDADSIAVANHPMIDRIWTERLPVGTVMIATRPGGGWRFRAALACERLRERMVDELKTRRRQFEDWRKRSATHAEKKPAESAAG